MRNFNWPGKRWFTQRRTIQLCQKFYQNIPSFTLAQQARAQQGQFSYEYIYGEINFASFAQVLSRCKITPESIFYDLGSGTGKAVICAALLYDFKKVCGIEHLALLHDCAMNLSKQLNKNIYFYQADLLIFDWKNADILFINASAYIGDFWQQLSKQLTHLKVGTQIILVSKLLPENLFTLLYSDFVPMSWGLARVAIYVKKN